MADTITLASTSDTLEQVQAALGVPPEQRATENPEPTEHQPATAKGSAKAPEAKKEAPKQEAKPAEEVKKVEEPVKEAPKEEVKIEEDPVVDEETGEPLTPGQAGGIKRSKLNKRIKELVTARDRASGEAAANAAEVNALRSRLDELIKGRPAEPAEEKKEAAPAKPKQEDFATYDEYVEAVADFKAEQISERKVQEALKLEREATARASNEQVAQNLRQQYETTITAAREKYEDYDEVVQRPDILLTRTMHDSMVVSAMGAEVAYYLGQHPEEAAKLHKLGDSLMAVKEFGKLEARVEAKMERDKEAAEKAAKKAEKAAVVPVVEEKKEAPKAAAAPRAVTKAPEPISPVGTTGEAVTEVPMDQLPYQQYKALRNRQERERLGQR